MSIKKLNIRKTNFRFHTKNSPGLHWAEASEAIGYKLPLLTNKIPKGTFLEHYDPLSS